MRRKWLIINCIVSIWSFAIAQDQVTYIRKYQDIAMSEMVRSGIPASIKLAQAILESNCGQSDLACKANNHFGIKCGGSWSGKSFHKEDDDYANGQLVKSCFREFDSVLESYRAHSDFLADPAKVNRYGSLFQLDITDYKGWAHGLSKAGYATDPQYANRLIQIIEKYELYRFDSEYEHLLATKEPPASSGYQIVKSVNDATYTIALEGDNALFIAKRSNLSANQVMRFNEEITSKEMALTAGTRIFLEPRKSRYSGKEKYHTVKEGEDLVVISKLYGIKLSVLAKRNGLEPFDFPAPKQKIMLKGKSKAKIKTINPYEVPSRKNQKELPAQPGGQSPGNGIETEIADADVSSKSINAVLSNPSDNNTHLVMKGDTLYAISRRYGVSLEQIRSRNGLAADTIYVGQKLVLK
jgi:LysM repeat protein